MRKEKSPLVLGFMLVAMLAAAGTSIGEEPETYMPDANKVLEVYDTETNVAQAQEMPKLSVTLEKSAEDVDAFVPPSGKGIEEIGKEMTAEEVFSGEIFNQLVTLDFKDAEIQDVLRLISVKTGLNIIMSKEQVKGTVTFHLDNVPLGVALESILKTRKLAMVKEKGGIVRIVPITEVRTKDVETKTIFVPVNWVKAGTLANVLKPFLTKDGSLAAADESNSLIITDTPPNLEEIQALIEKLDVPEKQVMIEARLVDMSTEAMRELGIQWDFSTEDNDGVSPFIGTLPDPTAISEGFGTMLSNKSKSAGLDLWLGEKLSVFGNDWYLSMRLNALEERSLAEVLANPRVLTLNNMPATIEIKREIPYLETTYQDGIAVGTSVKFKDASINLEVTPNITNNGYVRLHVKPSHKIFRGMFVASSTEESKSVPKIDERMIDTNLIIKDEQTAVIGGLKQFERFDTRQKVPWLGHIPVIGWLFKNKANRDDKLEMVLFVTPHIIKEPGITDYQKSQFNLIDTQWHLPDKYYEDVDLQKYFDMFIEMEE